MKDSVNIIALKRKLNKLSISTSEGFILLDYGSILYMNSDNNYTIIYLDNNKKITSTKNLGYYENILKNKSFLRIHNSYLVNLTKVSKYINSDGGKIIINNNISIPVSRSRKGLLLKLFV